MSKESSCAGSLESGCAALSPLLLTSPIQVSDMAAELLNPMLGFGAGALTILSPCVLPLVPVVLASSAQRHRMGPFALALGLVFGFVSAGFILAVFGSRLGIETEQIRFTGALILIAAGMILLLPRLQDRIAGMASPAIAWAARRQRGFEDKGLLGQAAIGMLLGIVWSPCVGPTLGAATALAAQGSRLSEVAATMTAFGAGIASMLVLIALLGQKALNRFRSGISVGATRAKVILGLTLSVIGLAIVTGYDRTLEAALLAVAPDWMIALTTSL